MDESVTRGKAKDLPNYTQLIKSYDETELVGYSFINFVTTYLYHSHFISKGNALTSQNGLTMRKMADVTFGKPIAVISNNIIEIYYKNISTRS
jgi:hypothetical protein